MRENVQATEVSVIHTPYTFSFAVYTSKRLRGNPMQ